MSAVSEREFLMTRIFDAPREHVFQAHVDSSAIPRWWGTPPTTTTVEENDVRVGGAWRYTMRKPDGAAYTFSGEFQEIIPNELLVHAWEFEKMPGHVVKETVVFDDVDGRTRVTMTHDFSSQEDRDDMLASGWEAGHNQSWDRLAEYLAANPK